MIGGALRALTLLLAFAVVLAAATLYRVKTETREVRAGIRALEGRQSKAQARIDALDTEWAYLNSPGYLAEAVARHDDALRLEDRVPDNFARLIELPPRGALAETDR